MAISEIDIFLNADDFAVSVTWTPSGGSSSSQKVLWWEPGEVIQIADIDVVLDSFMMEIKSSAVGAAEVNDIVVKDGVTYYALQFLPDGNGLTKVKLSKEQA